MSLFATGHDFFHWRAGWDGPTEPFWRDQPQGDDYHRFIPLMESTPDWKIGLGLAISALFLAGAVLLVFPQSGVQYGRFAHGGLAP